MSAGQEYISATLAVYLEKSVRKIGKYLFSTEDTLPT